MPRLLSGAFRLKNDPRILKLPPYLSVLCILVGAVWLLLLPLDNYSRRTYISENALLPGQVHTYFGGSDQNVFRAYRHEINALADGNATASRRNDELARIFAGIGLKTARQAYRYSSSSSAVHGGGGETEGENIYAVLPAPRGDATEAIVLVAAWRNVRGEVNRNGVALLLTLARYFRRWSLWSKDIVLLVTPDSAAGPRAWVDAYHDAHMQASGAGMVASLPVKSGALQGAVAIDFAREGRFRSVHVAYDGVNGQLPNLDLINSVVSIAGGQMGMGVAIQEMWDHPDGYRDRLDTMLRGMLKQGLGVASGPHSAFIPYHVDAVTLQPFGDGWQDEMAMGRVIEGTFRSLNNLLEKLHQSFFFYLLMATERFVSIGTYLPSAMLVAANFTIMAISLWVKSGQPEGEVVPGMEGKKGEKARLAVERHLFLPLGVVTVAQASGVVPLWVFNHTPASLQTSVFVLFLAFNIALPHVLSALLTRTYNPTSQQYQLITSFSLLLLGMFLSSLATLNFSLALIVGLLASPLSFVRPASSRLWSLPLALISPPAVLLVAAAVLKGDDLWAAVGDFLREAAFGWAVMGLYTPVVVWCVWWPAWVMGSLVVLGRPGRGKAKVA